MQNMINDLSNQIKNKDQEITQLKGVQNAAYQVSE
jgi:hypothetical protein